MAELASPRRQHLDLATVGWGALLSLPLVAYVLLRAGILPDSEWALPAFHFFIVTLAAAMGLVVAILIAVIVRSAPEPGAVFLSLAFFSIAGFFFVHGVLTPGVWYRGFSSGIVWSPPLGLLAGAAAFVASAMAGGPRWAFALRLRRALLALTVATVITFGAVTAARPTLLPVPQAAEHEAHAPAGLRDAGDAYAGSPQSGAPVMPPRAAAVGLWGTTVGALVLFLVAARRHYNGYRLSKSPLHGALAAGLVLFAEAAVVLATSETWYASWWLYHGLVLAAFGIVASGIIVGTSLGYEADTLVGSLFLRDAIAHLEQSYTEVIAALVAAVEARDPHTRGHSSRVGHIAVRIGQDLRVSPEQLRVLHQAALLHDVGKIGVPDTILNKPGTLTPQERALVESHTVRGERMLRGIPSLRPLLGGIRSHHERLDGSGYPDGLRDGQIPWEAKIIAVADVYEAMTSDRSYRRAHEPEDVLRYLGERSGTQFDREAIDALHHVLGEFPELRTPAGDQGPGIRDSGSGIRDGTADQ